MTEQEYVVYDFRLAEAADESASAFRTWIAKASQAFAEHWPGIAESDGSIATTNFRTQSFDSAMENAAASDICCTVNLTDEDTQTIWHVSQNDAQQVVAELLGMSSTVELEERPLTELELVLIRSFFETLAKSVRQGWLGSQPLTCGVESIQLNPKRIRLCRSKDLVITGTLLIEHARGEATIHWISRKQEMSVLLEQVLERRRPSGSGNDPRAVVELLPIEIVGLLGQASIPMRKLASISVGDIVPLNQRIDQPIVASVAGKPFFQCWPGKIGKTVGLEIASCIGTPESLTHLKEQAVQQ